MLAVIENLLSSCKSNGIPVCNWKGHFDIEKPLRGIGDLDVYVPNCYQQKFNVVAKELGFRRARSFQAHHEHIEHYYCLDSDLIVFAHLHVYFKIVTGGHASKNYDLPLGEYILRNIDYSSPMPAPSQAAKQNIFLLRYFLKSGSLYGALELTKEKKKYQDEWSVIAPVSSFEEVKELSIGSGEMRDLADCYQNTSNLRTFFTSVFLKWRLKRYRRRRLFEHQIYILTNLLIRLLNKTILKKNKVLDQGELVAICGLDGCGKSSLVAGLAQTFSPHFRVVVCHIGRPPSTALTAFINPLIKLYSAYKAFRGRSFTGLEQSKKRRVSNIFALRAVLLAYDRKAIARRAKRLSQKGYLVFCDRYPGLEIGKMDSPRVHLDANRSFLYRLCYKLEQNIYASIGPAEKIFHLQVPLAVALERNSRREKFGKESDDELTERFATNSRTTFLGSDYNFIDATESFDAILRRVANATWHT